MQFLFISNWSETVIFDISQTPPMASKRENVVHCYAVSRFVGEVSDDLICSICLEVPKEPRVCQNGDHLFCLDHITRHLHENSHTCPVCRDSLTPETLTRPSRYLKNSLDRLKIKCEHHDRGCPDIVQLENLQRHVDQCEFAPVKCENEGCGMTINKRGKENHLTHFCQFRIPRCHDCQDIKEMEEAIQLQIRDMKKNIDEMKIELTEKMTGMQQSVDGMKKQFEEMLMMVNQTLKKSNVNNYGAQALDQTLPVKSHDIIIIGGYYAPGNKGVLNIIENYNIDEEKSSHLPRLNLPRATPKSCVYKSDVIVTGGYDGKCGTEAIEILRMNEQPLRWKTFDGKLPVKLSGHVVRLFRDNLYVIGGINWSERKTSDGIYELSLLPPYTSKLVIRMQQPRRNHTAEIVNGELFILGGTTTLSSKDAIDSVVAYDFIKSKFRKCPVLIKPICSMSTVTWGNTIIIIGGVDQNEQPLNDVIMYDTETGRSQSLPPMIHKRGGPCAVIINDAIVVLGGWNEEQQHLNSVEIFTIGCDGWKELPGMKEKRAFATAVVRPRDFRSAECLISL